VVGGIVFGIVSWVRRRFSLRTFLVVAPLLLLVNVAGRFNQWPALAAAFSTAQPYELQVIVLVVTLLIGPTALALGVAVLGGYVTRATREPQLGPAGRWMAGAAVACLAAGIGASVSSLAPSFEPAWASYAPLAAYVPLAVPPLDAVSQVVVASVIGWFFLGLVDHLTTGWTKRKAAGGAFFLVLGFAAAGLAGIDSLAWWAATGVLTGAFGLTAYVFVFRQAPEALAVAVAATHTLGAIKAAWSGAYPGVALSQGLRVAMLFATAWLLLYLWKPRAGREEPAPTATTAQG
jgi:hypothetical protein